MPNSLSVATDGDKKCGAPREILKGRDTINGLYAKHTGQPVGKIQHDSERDNFMSAAEAKDYGLIDEVLPSGERAGPR
jgi:ATP-dependent protease ClpP protease subunit